VNQQGILKWRLQQSSKWKCFLGLFGALLAVPLTGGFTDEGGLGAFALVAMMAIRVSMPLLFLWGCSDLARSKGYSWILGFLGILGCIGWLVILLLPDQWQTVPVGFGESATSDTNYVRDPNRP
jgi:hypothetical protein